MAQQKKTHTAHMKLTLAQHWPNTKPMLTQHWIKICQRLAQWWPNTLGQRAKLLAQRMLPTLAHCKMPPLAQRRSAIWVYIYHFSSKCDAVGSFNVCIYQFLKRSNKFSYLSSCSRNKADLARYCRADLGSYEYLRAVYVHILVCIKCDAVGSFPVCIY